jgi:hypothetical protein
LQGQNQELQFKIQAMGKNGPSNSILPASVISDQNPIDRLALVELATELKFLKDNLDKERSQREQAVTQST